MDIILGETDPNCVYFQPDVFWMVHAGLEPSGALRLFDGRAFYLHVADYAVPAVRSEKIADYYAPSGAAISTGEAFSPPRRNLELHSLW